MENLYIVLDGNNATLADNDTSLYWTIPDHYFKNMKDPQGKVNLSLVSAIFTCSTTTLFTVDTESCEILTDLQLSNSMNTNSVNTLGFIDGSITPGTPDIIVNRRTANESKIDLEVSKFTSIKIQIKKQNVLCFFTAIDDTVDKSYCKFILNLQYHKY